MAIVRGRARATACAAIAAAVDELLALDVAEWHTRGGLARIKERTVRSVFAGELAGTPVHVKVFRADTLADRARDAVRQPRGEREVHNLLRARERGLPAVEPLAFGVATDGREQRSFVVTRTAPNAVPFAFTAPREALRRAGSLLRSMHDDGVQPGDLHAENLLVDAAGAPWLVDLTSVRFGDTPSLARRASALALFCQDLDGGALDPAARELLAGYAAAGRELPATFLRELRLATHRWRAHALVAFGRRALRSCKHTFAEERRRARPRWYVHLPAGAAETVVAECTRLLADPGEPHKSGRRGAVWLHADHVVKERDAGAARRLWRGAYWLLFARVPIARPVALCIDRGHGFVFTERLPWPSLAAEIASRSLDANAITAAARSLGDALGRLHAHGLRNRDLKFDNLVRDPASGVVHIVDLDGVRRAATTDTRGQGADLGRLLAAFRGAGSPGDDATVRTFLRSYRRAHRHLLQDPPLRRIVRRAEQRAGEWRSAHAN